MSHIISMKLLGPLAGSYRRETRHDCHCGPRYLRDLDGSCQWCGRFPRALVAELNEDRKTARAIRKTAA